MPHNILPVTVMYSRTGYTVIRVNNTPDTFDSVACVQKIRAAACKPIYKL